MTNKIVGIFGGAFDPVHKGHIKIAEQCIETIGMEKIIIVPTGVSPFKKDLTNEKTRLSILQIAFSKDHYEISDYELRQSKKDKNPSYTINTLKFLTKEFFCRLLWKITRDLLSIFFEILDLGKAFNSIKPTRHK